MTQTLGSNIVSEDGNSLLYSGSSDPYDIGIRFDPTCLGATVIDLPQTHLCQFCNFSVGEKRITATFPNERRIRFTLFLLPFSLSTQFPKKQTL